MSFILVHTLCYLVPYVQCYHIQLLIASTCFLLLFSTACILFGVCPVFGVLSLIFDSATDLSRYYIFGDEDFDRTHAISAQYGCLKEFRPHAHSIKAYLEHASLSFQANDIDEGKPVPILLSLIGASNYALLHDLVAPDVPGTLSFARIAEVLSSHFESKRSVIVEHFHFHRCTQATRQSITEFEAALRKLATPCEFDSTLEEMFHN